MNPTFNINWMSHISNEHSFYIWALPKQNRWKICTSWSRPHAHRLLLRYQTLQNSSCHKSILLFFACKIVLTLIIGARSFHVQGVNDGHLAKNATLTSCYIIYTRNVALSMLPGGRQLWWNIQWRQWWLRQRQTWGHIHTTDKHMDRWHEVCVFTL